MKCSNPSCRMYGKELAPGAKFCGVCGQIVKEERVFGEPPAERSVRVEEKTPVKKHFVANRMPQGIALGVDERVVKQYSIGRYTFRQGSIDVIVTNKRVIRYEESSLFGMKNNQIDEINIDSVHGTSTHMRRSISIPGLIVSLYLLFLSMAAFFGRMFGIAALSSMYSFFAGSASLIIAIVIIVNSLKPAMDFSLLASFGSEALGTHVNKRGRIIRSDTNSIVFQFKPTPQTTEMLKEIGACIYDLKTLGDAAIEKWC